jgi:hypothetical protein
MHMYVCMYVRTHDFMYVGLYVRTYMYIPMYVYK